MVLSASPIGEYDKRLVILTREYGKISAFARGARKQTSPLLACTQPFAFGSFTLFRGKNSFTVNNANIDNYFNECKESLEAVAYACYFCELADCFSVENLDGSEVLKLLYQSFRALIVPTFQNRLVRAVFEWKILGINGEGANVFSCLSCGKKENLHLFLPQRQGIYCETCGTGVKGIHITETTVYTLQRILSSPIKSLYTFKVSDEVLNQLCEVTFAYMKNRADRTFHSLEMLEGMGEL